MRYRYHMGMKISEVSIGTYALSGVYGQKDLAEFRRMILRAYELGVNFFDTAEGYGQAEEVLGEVVRPFREEINIATKVGLGEGRKPNLSRDHVLRACEKSLRRLNTDYIDLYQVHFSDPNTPVEETVEALEDLVSEGKIRYYGVCHLPIETIEKYCVIGRPFSVLAEVSAVARGFHRKLIPLNRRYKLGIIAFSVTGRGMLTGKVDESTRFNQTDIRHLDPLFQHDRFKHGLKVARELARVGKELSMTPAQVAISWVLSQEGIISALSGPSTTEHLEENVEACNLRIPRDKLEEIDKFLQREERQLRTEEAKTVKRILNSPIRDAQRGFVDLIYAIEAAVDLDMLDEEEVLPLFHELYALKAELTRERGPVAAIDEIREKMLSLLTSPHEERG